MSNIVFRAPYTIEEALKYLSEPNTKPLAGGTDLLVKLKNNMLQDLKSIVDLSNLGLNKIYQDNNNIVIESGCTMTQIASDSLINTYYPALVSAVSSIGAVQIRNMATIGGNVANASPAGDSIPALYSLNAIVNIVGVNKARSVKIEHFFTGPGKTVLDKSEFITSFTIPMLKTKGVFKKLGERKAQAISKINLAFSTWKEDDKTSFAIAFGSVGPTVIRCRRIESLLEKHDLTEENINTASKIASELITPITDLRSTQSYRSKMAEVLLRRALLTLL